MQGGVHLSRWRWESHHQTAAARFVEQHLTGAYTMDDGDGDGDGGDGDGDGDDDGDGGDPLGNVTFSVCVL